MNDFESLIYEIREWVQEDAHQIYLTQEEQDTTLSSLMEAEDWLLYGEGDTASASEFTKRRNELNKPF